MEFLYHLIFYKLHHACDREFVFLVHPDIKERLDLFDLPDNWQEADGIKIIYPDRIELEHVEKENSPFKKALIEFKIVRRVVKEIQPQICFFMYLNAFQFAIGTPAARSLPCRLRGILFNPFGTKGINAPASFTKFRKSVQLSWMMSNKSLDRIFILNNKGLACDLNKKYKKENFFVSLPDPILLVPASDSQVSTKNLFFQSSSRIHFLLFGSLSRRKGVFVLLDALKMLPKDKAANIEVLLAGKADGATTQKELQENLYLLKKSKPELAVRHLDEFINYQDIQYLFSETDCVLLPYIGNEASSGILGHAALYKKPVLANASGLLGKLVTEYNLGVTVQEMNSKILSEYIINFKVNSTSVSNSFEEYVRDHHSLVFSETLCG